MLQTEETAGNNSTGTSTETGATESASTSTGANRSETGTIGSASTGTEPNATGSTETTGSTDGGGTGTVPSLSDNRPRLVRLEDMPEPPAKGKRGPKGPWKHKKEIVELNPDPDYIPDPTPIAKFEKLNAKDLNLMICGTFDMLAVILGKHWAISEAEGEKISKPASRILSRMAISKTINKYSDYTVLLMSVIGVVGPRLLFTLSMNNEPKGGLNNVSKANVNDGPTANAGNRVDGEKREVTGNPAPPQQPVTYPVSNILHQIQPAVMP